VVTWLVFSKTYNELV